MHYFKMTTPVNFPKKLMKKNIKIGLVSPFLPEKDGMQGEIMKDKEGNTLYVEVSRGPYFCQDPEDAQIFTESNPDTRTESFTVQVRKSTAIKYLDAPDNMKQFERKV